MAKVQKMGWKEKLKKAIGPRPGSPVWKWQQQRRGKIKKAKEKAPAPSTSLPHEVERLLERYERKRLIDNKLIENIRKRGEPAADENLRRVNIGFWAFLVGTIVFGGLVVLGIVSFLLSPLVYRPFSYWLGFGFIGFIAVICIVITAALYIHRQRMYRIIKAFERAEVKGVDG